MNRQEIYKFISGYFLIFSALVVIPFLIAFWYQFFIPAYLHPQPHSTLAFLLTILCCLALGFTFRYLGKDADGRRFFRKEGFLSLCIIWFLSGIIGGLPFLLSKTFDNPIDAYFEAMSGITTTGCTVIYPMQIDPVTHQNMPINVVISEKMNIKYRFYGNIRPIIDPKTGIVLYAGTDAISKAILFWRCLLQWLGGMGIVILFIAVLPAYGLGGNKLLVQAELPGPSSEDLAPKAKDAASLLWKTYLAISILGIFFLRIFNPNLSVMDAVYIVMATVSTGGFLPYQQSLHVFNNPTLQWMLILLMIIGSINFSLIFQVIKGKLYRLMDPELLLFLLTLVIGGGFIVASIVGKQELLLAGLSEQLNFKDAMRIGLFQYISCQSTTGMLLLDYDQWPHFAQAIMVTAMFIGAMSCSTGGGIKIMRYYILLLTALYRTEAIFQPEVVRTFRIRNQPVNPTIKETTLSFFFIAIVFTLVSTLVYIADGIDFRTAFTTAATMINNVGVAYGPGGPSQTFTFMSNFSKFISTFWMVLGRLEYYMILILLTRAFWRKA